MHDFSAVNWEGECAVTPKGGLDENDGAGSFGRSPFSTIITNFYNNIGQADRQCEMELNLLLYVFFLM